MGALVGGLEAAGRLDQYTAWASSLTQRAILRLLDPSLTSAGVLRAEKVLEAVREILELREPPFALHQAEAARAGVGEGADLEQPAGGPRQPRSLR